MILFIFAGLCRKRGNLRRVLRVGTVAEVMLSKRKEQDFGPKERTHICNGISFHIGSRVDLRKDWKVIELENRCKVIKGDRDGREGLKLKRRYWS